MAQSELDAPTVERIRDAFAQGQGHGLFHLGAVEATSALPPVFAFWRDFGRVFMTAVCADPDLDERRDWLPLSIPRILSGLSVEAAPPMIGGEYLSVEVLEGLWGDIEVACRSELVAFEGSVQAFLRTKNPVWNQVAGSTFTSPSRSATRRRRSPSSRPTRAAWAAAIGCSTSRSAGRSASSPQTEPRGAARPA